MQYTEHSERHFKHNIKDAATKYSRTDPSVNILRRLYLKNLNFHQENSLVLYAAMRLGDFTYSEVETFHPRNKSMNFTKLFVESKNYRFGQLLRVDEDFFVIFEVKKSFEQNVCVDANLIVNHF